MQMTPRNIAIVAVTSSFAALGAVSALAFDYLTHGPAPDACRVQVQDSEQRIRHALWEANRATEDRIGVLIKALGVAK